jgi:hypothetical protein
MLLTPRLAYQREYLGAGLIQGGPACGLIRADVFRAAGGYDERLGVGADSLFWLKVCAKHNVLLVPGDLFWYRLHPDQEYQSPRALREYAIMPREMWRALDDPACPLTPDERAVARRNQAYSLIKYTYRDCRARRFGLAWLRLRESGLTLGDWLRYARRPRRHLQAGTPLDGAGDFLTPDWQAYSMPDARQRGLDVLDAGAEDAAAAPVKRAAL